MTTNLKGIIVCKRCKRTLLCYGRNLYCEFCKEYVGKVVSEGQSAVKSESVGHIGITKI